MKRETINTLRCGNSEALATALRTLFTRVVGGFFKRVQNERLTHALAREHTSALLALRQHHDAMLLLYPRNYLHRREDGSKASLSDLYDFTVYALAPLELAEVQVASDHGACSAPDQFDIDYLKARS